MPSGQPRSSGSPATMSAPSTSACHIRSGVSMPPGNRQAMPTMTIGSDWSATAARMTVGAAGAAWVASTSWSRWRVSSSTLGWLKISVLCSGTPIAATSRSRSSTAVSESKPISKNARPGSTASVPVCPSTAATCWWTTSRTAAARAWGSRPASRSASPDPVRGPASGDASAPVRSASSGLGRWEVKTETKSAQLISTTSSAPPAPVSTRPRVRTVASGSITGRPLRRSVSYTSTDTMPAAPAHGPQAIDQVGTPSAVRRTARASR